ncbi:PhoU domain-containing protein [Montanilutibacter psychrotolerans]|uniref:Phosphate uptake regulator PhoU n=1 Tax=Montanilutibacter psychrotolerans TaxID=1327343 RepID=A0A3M8SZP3_9GAMM|nr:phosphate uptake regulator PhoU [Lysobacter psychrotolerans]RNF86175.1 phosphate uptake regulator PhoU [Lysobacter psychrotolerans]
MNTNFDGEREALRARLAAAFREVQQQLADAVRALERNDARLARDVHRKESRIEGELHSLERDAVGLAGRSANADDVTQFAISVVQMSASLRHVDRMADQLGGSAMAIANANLPDELAGQLHHMAELALLQFTTAQEALAARVDSLAERTLKRDIELDNWYELLLKECFDDVAERGEVPGHLAAMLSTAKLLERISGHSMTLREEVVALVSRA